MGFYDTKVKGEWWESENERKAKAKGKLKHQGTPNNASYAPLPCCYCKYGLCYGI